MPCGPAAYLGGCCDGGGGIIVGQEWRTYAYNRITCFATPGNGCTPYRTVQFTAQATVGATIYNWGLTQTTETCPGNGDGVPLASTGTAPGFWGFRATAYSINTASGDILDINSFIIGSWTATYTNPIDVGGKVGELIGWVNSQPQRSIAVHSACPGLPDVLPDPFSFPIPVYPYAAAAISSFNQARPVWTTTELDCLALRSQRIIAAPGVSTILEVGDCGASAPPSLITFYPASSALLIDIKAPVWNGKIRYI